MSVAARLKQFMESHKVGYRVLYHARADHLKDPIAQLDLNPQFCAKVMGVADEKGVLIAIIPMNAQLNLPALNKLTRREFKVTSRLVLDKLFIDCEPGAHPILAEPYGVNMVVDSSFHQAKDIYFSSGTHTALVKIAKDDLRFLTANQMWGPIAFVNNSVKNFSLLKQNEADEQLAPFSIPFIDPLVQASHSHYQLPKLPEMLMNLISLGKWQTPAVDKIFEVLNEDKSLTQSISGFIQSQSQYLKAGNLQMAFEMGLDYDTFLVYAMRYSIEQQFQLPKVGPLGLNAFWLYAQSCALLSKYLAKECKPALGIVPCVANLCGLVHNFGLLLMGHWFAPEYRLMNKLMGLNPKEPITKLEKRIIGMGHAQQAFENGHAILGAWLMNYWHMPPEVLAVAKFHHSHYDGEHAPYVDLVVVVDQLLKTIELGDGENAPLNEARLHRLGLSHQIIDATLQRVFDEHPHLSKVSMSTCA